MAGSGTYQVAVGRHQDIAAPFLAGTKTLSNALQGITDNKLNQDKLDQSKLEHANRMEQMNLDRQERINARKAASGRADRARADAKAQSDAIRGALTSFNTPGGINTGLETQTAVNTSYNNVTNNYNGIMGLLEEQQSNNTGILNAIEYEELNKYDGDGKKLISPTRAKLETTMFDIEQAQNDLDNEYASLTTTLDTPLANIGMQDPRTNADPLAGIGQPEYKEENDLLGSLATQGNQQIAEQKTALDTVFNTEVGALNEKLTTRYEQNPQVLDTVTNPERVANDMYQSLLQKNVDPTIAAKTADTWYKANVKEVDKTLVTALKDQEKALRDQAAEVTITKGTTSTSGKKGSSGVSFKGKEDTAKQVFNYFKLGKDRGYFDNMLTDTVPNIRTKIEELKANNAGLTDKQAFYALINADAGSGREDERASIDLDTAQAYINSGGIEARSSLKGDANTQTKTKQKVYTKQQKEQLKGITANLQQALQPNPTVASNLGKDFVKEATTDPKLIDALKVGTAPRNKTKVPTKQIATPKQPVKPVENKVITTSTPTPKPKVKTKAEIAKLNPKEKKVYATMTYADKVFEGAGIKWEQAKADPAGTAQDIGLGVLNSFPALINAVGDLIDVETPGFDSLSKVLKGARTDKNSLGFDLAEATGLPAKVGLKAAVKATKGTVLGKALPKAPSLGTALGKTVKAVNPTNIANKVTGFLKTKANKVTKAKRAYIIKDIRTFIRENSNNITTQELKRLQRKIKALTNAK